jgi:hypothetical protein
MAVELMASDTFSALSQGWQTWPTLPTTWILQMLAGKCSGARAKMTEGSMPLGFSGPFPVSSL